MNGNEDTEDTLLTLTADIVAKEAVMILDNELVMAKKVFRA